MRGKPNSLVVVVVVVVVVAAAAVFFVVYPARFFQTCKRRKGHKHTTAVDGCITEMDFDVSYENDTYDGLIRRLADDIVTSIREQLTTYG